LVKDRFFPHAMTSLYDPSLQCYINICHTACIEDRHIPNQQVALAMLFHYFFFKVNDSDTRVIHTVYTDINVPIAQSKLFKKVIKTRSGILKQGFETCLKKGKLDKVDDFLQYNRAVKENSDCYPDRSWYLEYQEKKQ